MLKRVNIVTPIFEPISGEEKSVKSPKFHSHTSKPPIVVKPSRRDDFYANNELLVCSSFSKQTATRFSIFVEISVFNKIHSKHLCRVEKDVGREKISKEPLSLKQINYGENERNILMTFLVPGPQHPHENSTGAAVPRPIQRFPHHSII